MADDGAHDAAHGTRARLVSISEDQDEKGALYLERLSDGTVNEWERRVPAWRGAITWDTNQFGWGKAIVDDDIFISAPGDQGTEVEGVFRSGTVFIYQYAAGVGL